MDCYTVNQFAQLTGKDPGNIRRLLISGDLSGEKVGRQWLIPKGTTYPEDKRIKTGKYLDFRRKLSIGKDNPGLIRTLENLCKEFKDIYGDKLLKVVLYGSYARKEEEADSDVDIALFVDGGETEEMHDRMIDVVVDYELEHGKTFSVVRIEKENYKQWERVLPFYENINKEGITLWKTQKESSQPSDMK